MLSIEKTDNKYDDDDYDDRHTRFISIHLIVTVLFQNI